MEGIKTDDKGRFVKGTAPGPGRPAGSISAITRVKQIFEENPEKFNVFIDAYIEDPANRKHIVEMIDGKPKQETDIKGQITNLNAELTDEQFDRIIRQRAEELASEESVSGTV